MTEPDELKRGRLTPTPQSMMTIRYASTTISDEEPVELMGLMLLCHNRTSHEICSPIIRAESKTKLELNDWPVFDWSKIVFFWQDVFCLT